MEALGPLAVEREPPEKNNTGMESANLCQAGPGQIVENEPL